MSNTITITNRGDSSQSIGETNKLIARIAVLEDRLTKLTDKSSKQADMMGKGYASAEAKVKHFEKALKDASNVRMKFAALEGLQKASREFKVAKADFESSLKIGQMSDGGMVGRLSAWQQSNKPSPMIAQLDAYKSQQQDQEAAARRQAMLERDAGVRERQMRIARARELDAKYALRASDERSYANSRPGVEIFNSESTIKARRALLLERKNNLPSEGDDFQKTITELREIDKLLKRINAKPMKAVELGSPKALRQQIKYLEAEMAKIGAGPQWDKLNAKLASAKTQLGGMQQKSRDAEKALSQAATAPMGSWVRLEYELEQAKKELSQLTYGTKEFLAQQAKVAGLQKDWDNVNTAINKTNKSQGDGSSVLNAIVGQVKSFAMTYVGIYQTAQLVTDEFNKHRQFQLESAKHAADLNRELLKQAPNIDIENVPEVKKFAIANAERLLTDPKDISHLIGVAQSSSAKTLKGAIAGAEAALMMTLGDVAQSEELLTGGLMIASLNNSENSKAALGQLRTTSKVSLATDEAQFIGNVLPAITGLSRGTKNINGITTEQSLELVGAFSRIMGDREGSTTNTNLMSMRTSFDDFNPVRKKKLKDGKISILDQKTIDAFNAERDLFKRRQMMIDNPELGNQFLNLQKRGGPRNLAQAWLHPTASDERFMKEAKDTIPSFAAGEAVFDSVVKQARDQNAGLVARQGRKSGTIAAMSSDKTALPGEARSGWDAIWNGDGENSALNLTGLDMLARVEAGGAMSSQRMKRVDEGLPVNEGDTYRAGVKYLIDREKRMGKGSDESQANIRALEAILRSMEAVKDGIDQLNSQVAAGRQGHHVLPQRAAQAVRVPPVPRVPIAAGSLMSGDPFGMRKR